MTIWDALFLAVIEGLTEFLPVSSTGHMIIYNHFRDLSADPFVRLYVVSIQIGAIAAVAWIYRDKLWPLRRDRILSLLLVSAPAGAAGLLLEKRVDQWLGSIHVVIASLIAGGVVLVLADRRSHPGSEPLQLENISPRQLLWVGCCQALALVPGVSRSGATILGGIWQGLSRSQAAELSFLAALPIMAAATALKVYKTRDLLTVDHGGLLALGLVTAFVVAWWVVRGLVRYVAKHSFAVFGVYRIVLGVVLLLLT